MTLWNEDNILIKDISKETYFDSGTLTPILKRLEEKSYIQRVPSLEDERGKLIKLTQNGKELKKKLLIFSKIWSVKLNYQKKNKRKSVEFVIRY